jgi:predicted  nucleic acid-binding Zn-ribbon protein
MQETLRLLKSLQELDQDLFRVKESLRRLPEELARRRAKIDGERARQDEIEKRLFDLRLKVREIEDLTSGARLRVKKLESESANARADTALIVAFQHEIRSLRRDISESEEEGLALVAEIENVTATQKELRASLEAAELEFAEYSANVERETRAAKARQKALLEDRRKRIGTALAPDVRSKYEKLLEAREGRALAQLEGRICLGCNVNVPSNVYVRLARGTELVECPSCGRILYLSD